MTFPPSLLHEGEEIAVDLNPNWSTLFQPIGAVVLSVVVGILLYRLSHAAGWVGLVLFLAAAAWLVRRFLWWRSTSFTVTSTRVIYRSGVVAKHGREIPLERITNIEFEQTVFERMIGSGDLFIESAGQGSRATFEDIPHPSQVQNLIYTQIQAKVDRNVDRMAGGRELSVPEQIEKLAELRDRGVITPAEFDATKQQLLSGP